MSKQDKLTILGKILIGRGQQRFWSKVELSDDCWNWKASTNELGYGIFSIKSRPVSAHRVAYLLLRGELLPGFELDHLCRNPSCVNPDHLEQVSHQENTKRGLRGVMRSARNRCGRGHNLLTEHGYISRGKRHCRTCARAANKAWQHKKLTTTDNPCPVCNLSYHPKWLDRHLRTEHGQGQAHAA